jgi:NitT/TauT family transport system permease protein
MKEGWHSWRLETPGVQCVPRRERFFGDLVLGGIRRGEHASAPKVSASGRFALGATGDLLPTTSIKARRQPGLGARRLAAWSAPAAVLAALLLWEGLSRWAGLPAFILPPPSAVWTRFVSALQDGSLAHASLVTLTEVLAGLALGMATAVAVGYALAKSRTAERLLSPYIVASQSIPVVAIAPLLVIWFGAGRLSKVLIAALIVFFPILVNTVVGVRSVPTDLRDLMRSLRATRWQTLTKLEMPAALPVLFGGLKIGATLSVIGAVVGEFVGADEGLGFLVNVGRGLYDTSLVFVATFALIAMALVLYGLVAWLERRLLGWRNGDSPR